MCEGCCGELSGFESGFDTRLVFVVGFLKVYGRYCTYKCTNLDI